MITNNVESNRNSTNSIKPLSPEEKHIVQQLRQRDREVRAHEADHTAAAGHYATGGARFIPIHAGLMAASMPFQAK